MKVEQQQAKFSPVTITIENEQELKAFIEIFGAMNDPACKTIGFSTNMLYTSLKEIAKIYNISWQDKLKITANW